MIEIYEKRIALIGRRGAYIEKKKPGLQIYNSNYEKSPTNVFVKNLFSPFARIVRQSACNNLLCF